MSEENEWTGTSQQTRAAPLVVTVPGSDIVSSEILVRLLRMADDYRRGDSPHQAIEVYLELAEKYGEAVEGLQARDRLMAIAAEYQEQGNSHQARSLYERLLDPESQ